MAEGKKSAFDRATGAQTPEVLDENGEEVRSYVPRAVFTKDAKLDLSKLSIGMLRVAQGMTEEVKERKALIGQFVLTNYPAHDDVILVPFDAQDIRQYKPDPKKPPQCQAPTGDFGFGNPGGVCEECPLSHWGEYNEATGKSTPPPCSEGVTVRFYSMTHRCLVDYTFLKGERSKGAFIQQQGMSYGWSNFVIRMTTVEKSNNKGSWPVPQIEMLQDYPAEFTQEQRDLVPKWYEIHLASQVDSKEGAILQLQSGQQT